MLLHPRPQLLWAPATLLCPAQALRLLAGFEHAHAWLSGLGGSRARRKSHMKPKASRWVVGSIRTGPCCSRKTEGAAPPGSSRGTIKRRQFQWFPGCPSTSLLPPSKLRPLGIHMHVAPHHLTLLPRSPTPINSREQQAGSSLQQIHAGHHHHYHQAASPPTSSCLTAHA